MEKKSTQSAGIKREESVSALNEVVLYLAKIGEWKRYEGIDFSVFSNEEIKNLFDNLVPVWRKKIWHERESAKLSARLCRNINSASNECAIRKDSQRVRGQVDGPKPWEPEGKRSPIAKAFELR